MGHNILELDAGKPCLGNTHNFLFRVFPDMRAPHMRPFAVARLDREKSGKPDSKLSPEISTGKEGFQMQARGQFDTRIHGGRNRRALMRAEPGRPARLRIKALPPVGAILLAFAALLALPLQAQAQTLVSNVGQAAPATHDSLLDHDQAQAFTTGGNSAGYTLRSVEIDMQAIGENATAFTVSIHSNNSGAPGASLGTLRNPASLASTAVHAFTTRGIALAADTTYFVVIDSVGQPPGGGNQLYIINTSSNAQDPERAAGWSIGNDSLYRDWDSSGSWTSLGDSRKICVKGYNPTVSNASISIANAGHFMFDVTLSRAFQNTVKVDFETISGGTATEGEDYHARRTYTHVILAGDKTAQMGFALIEDTANDAGETVKVKISNARVVDAYGNVVKLLNITRDDATGTITAPSTSTTTVSNLTIRIDDTTGAEDDGWLDFKVRLSRAYTEYVCFDFETLTTGTATEGRDYTKRPKVNDWIWRGAKKSIAVVKIIDDSVNDDGETVKVRISNAHLCDDASKTVSITRAEATGTITNTDHMPKAWLARFGRTATEHVLDGVRTRMTAPRKAGLHASLAGIGFDDMVRTKPTHETVEDNLFARSNAMQDNAQPLSSRTPSGRDLLSGSAFALIGETTSGGTAGFWGRGAVTDFDGREGNLSLEGEVATGLLGADYGYGRWLLGMIASHSRGEGDYQGVSKGRISSTLTGLYPWARYAVSEHLAVWGAAGYGEGTLTLKPGSEDPMRTDLSLSMAAAGVRGELVARAQSGGLELALESDAMVVRTDSDSVSGASGRLEGAEADVSRVRLALDGAWRIMLEGGAALTPSLEVGVRHDGGDAERGFGADLGAGLTFTDLSRGLTFDVSARTLVTHEASGFQERGLSATLAFDPTPSSQQGLSLSLRHTLGAAATGGADALLGRKTLAGLGDYGNEDGGQLDVEAGYGMSAFNGRFTGTPWLGFATSPDGGAYRLGWRLAPAHSGTFDMTFGLEAVRRERTFDAEHQAQARLMLRW